MLPSTQVSPAQASDLVARIRLCLAILMAALVLLGVLHLRLVAESQWLLHQLARTAHFGSGSEPYAWILEVHDTLQADDRTAPFLAYSTDWLALAHILFALVFVGPYRSPVRNRWVISFGLIVSGGVLLLAFVAGPVHQIPLFWRGIDASFAILCALPLLLCRHYLGLLDRLKTTARRQRVRKHRRHVARRRSLS